MKLRIAALVVISLIVYLGLTLLPETPWVIEIWRYTIVVFIH